MVKKLNPLTLAYSKEAESFKQSGVFFIEFYDAYPKKIARKDAEKAWYKLTPEDQQQAIRAVHKHIEYWEATATEKQFIPHPATWLRGERFNDEVEMPKQVNGPGWWTTDQGIMDKARELKISSGGKGRQQLIDEIKARA